MSHSGIITSILFTFFIAWLSSNVLTHRANEKGVESNVRYYLDQLTLCILLPLLFMFSILKADKTPVHMLMFILGGILPLITLFVGKYFHLKSDESDIAEAYWKPFMFSTFGGGNRGTLLILVLSPLVISSVGSTLTVDDAVSYFAMFDLGNFACLMIVFKRYLMPNSLREALKLKYKYTSNIDNKGSETDILKYLPGLAAIIGLIPFFVSKFFEGAYLSQNFPDLVLYLNSTLSLSNTVSHIFTYTVFVSIFLFIKEVKGSMELGDWAKLFLHSFYARVSGFILCLLILLVINSSLYPLMKIDDLKVLIFCMAIFIILPPSSLFSVIVNDINKEYEAYLKKDNSEVYSKYENQLSIIVVSTIYLYFGVMGMTITYAIWNS